MRTRKMPLYRHNNVALLRASVIPMDRVKEWPDPSDVASCRAWLMWLWTQPDLADPIRHASPVLAAAIDAIQADDSLRPKQIYRATMSATRYVLRATGRSTPFGLFAGVAPVSLGSAKVRLDTEHQPIAHVDMQWLANVIKRLEECPALLERLEVVFNNLATQRGQRIGMSHAASTTTVRNTEAVQVVRNAAKTPIRYSELVSTLTTAFPAAEPTVIHNMLAELIRLNLLITCLRSPMTVTDPLGYVIDRLMTLGAADIEAVAPVLQELQQAQADLLHHNAEDTSAAERSLIRANVTRRLATLSAEQPNYLAVHMALKHEVQLPQHVLDEVARAASALIRLSSYPTGEPAWRQFYSAFCDRYGIGTLVPLQDVVDPNAGIGFPAGYPDSVLPLEVISANPERDKVLLKLVGNALADGSKEIILDEKTIQELSGSRDLDIPPHVELMARVHAESAAKIDNGQYLLTVESGYSFGTFTSRFTTITENSGLPELYGKVPTIIEDSLPVQLSFPPTSAHAENVCRVPNYLPHVLSLGEHRKIDESTIPLDDLAVTADYNRLYLVSISQRRVIEPQMFHALAIKRFSLSLARFLVFISRSMLTSLHGFHWGSLAEHLPYLPRIRYQHTILAPAQWRLTKADIAMDKLDLGEFIKTLAQWRERRGCPAIVELHERGDLLRLDLNQRIHVAILQNHLARKEHAILTETALPTNEYGWLGGHSHEIAVPLTASQSLRTSPIMTTQPVTTNHDHGQLPASPETRWLNAKLFISPEQIDELITCWLPQLLTSLPDNTDYWFIRYRSERETDHLRLRIATPTSDAYVTGITALGAWGHKVHAAELLGRIVIDTYYPEVGRYGHGPALVAAEKVFVADSKLVTLQCHYSHKLTVTLETLIAINMVAIAAGFLGDFDMAAQWLSAQPVQSGPAADRASLTEVTTHIGQGVLFTPPDITEIFTEAWQERMTALNAYRKQLSTDIDINNVLESLLHMHHNRAAGPDRKHETACRRLAKHAALAWIAHHKGRVL